MKWFGIFIAIVAAIGVAAINLRGSAKTYAHRYKLTVTVESAGNQRSGSSVIEVSWLEQPQNLPIPVPHFVSNVRGDAPVIDLDDGGALVAVLEGADPSYTPTPPEYLVATVFRLPDDSTSIPLLAKQRGIGELSGNDIPALILFGDRNDPRSARTTRQPTGPGRELAPGITFLSATIEMTSEPVTRTIERKLPWWSSPGRPAAVAWRAWLAGQNTGTAQGPESLFRRGRGE
jgi:hypothetical protein